KTNNTEDRIPTFSMAQNQHFFVTLDINDVVMLMPDNNDYHPYIIDENNPARILGKAVKVSFNL
ncbi:hypothetical protein P7D68_21665, partial [Enterococcus avium]|nr:hypothetical protein [Enterococcus avium]